MSCARNRLPLCAACGCPETVPHAGAWFCHVHAVRVPDDQAPTPERTVVLTWWHVLAVAVGLLACAFAFGWGVAWFAEACR